jgi:hypothetical protein
LTQPQFTYSAFGLVVRSNLPVPGLIPSHTSFAACVHFHLGVSPGFWDEGAGKLAELAYASAYLDEDGEPVLRAWRLESPALLHLVYSTGMQFWIDQHGDNVWATWTEASSLEESADFLLGPVFGALLRLRGVVCLHASAVALDGRAVALVGPPGTGKSTTAAILAERGCAVLADDVVGIAADRSGFEILPAYPFLHLWPDSLQMLDGSSPLFRRRVPGLDKHTLHLGEKFEGRPVPLGAICLLRERDVSSPWSEPVAPQPALAALLANSYATGILNSDMRARELELLGRLISSVPVRAIRVPEQPSYIDTFFEAFVRDAGNRPARSRD